jgi:ribonuclease-3
MNSEQQPDQQQPDQQQTALARKLGITFHNPDLLQSALMHRSFLNENPQRSAGLPSNERLEFLGDAVLNFLTTSWLYEQFPQHSEGELTSLRAALVKTATLAQFARSLGLGQHIRISRGADNTGGRERPALLADTFEAVLAAIYLDQGIATARAFIEPFLQAETARIATGAAASDYRTRLQERVQASHGVTPTYRTLEESGPHHRRQFTVEVLIQERAAGVGSGFSKQSAAQEAARAALAALEAEDEP